MKIIAMSVLVSVCRQGDLETTSRTSRCVQPVAVCFHTQKINRKLTAAESQ
jgi:hypothetical protein